MICLLHPSERCRLQQPQHANSRMYGRLTLVLRQARHEEQVLPHGLRPALLHLILECLPAALP